MNYADGRLIMVGDAVDLGDGQAGVVVGLIGDGEYADGYAAEDWGYLGHGILLSTGFGLLRLEAPDEDLELVARLGPDGLKPGGMPGP